MQTKGLNAICFAQMAATVLVYEKQQVYVC